MNKALKHYGKRPFRDTRYYKLVALRLSIGAVMSAGIHAQLFSTIKLISQSPDSSEAKTLAIAKAAINGQISAANALNWWRKSN